MWLVYNPKFHSCLQNLLIGDFVILCQTICLIFYFLLIYLFDLIGCPVLIISIDDRKIEYHVELLPFTDLLRSIIFPVCYILHN